ncbi:hypothetical protein RI129_001323 [Pyrocoelia pectoralis]|uniref:NADP-dependent oxidoreductase domain-containing protein n=1 Tax=Pyrocoelia pectoralis TaxID=417401 RepID=A0AAN7VV94_9COLE
MGYKEGNDLSPMGPDGNIEASDYDYVDTWKAIEEVQKKCLAKSIGISNFNCRQIERLLEKTSIVPVVNQVECHPYLNQSRLMEYCNSKGIKITAYSPLGSPRRPGIKSDDPVLLSDPRLEAIAKKYNKSPAQIAIKYQIQRGNIVIPKSATKSRLQENFCVFDFDMSAEDMCVIDSFNINLRLIIMEGSNQAPFYPFNDEY